MRRHALAVIACAIAAGNVVSAHALAQDGGTRPRAVSLGALLRYAERHAPAMIVARAEATRWHVDRTAADAPVPGDPNVQIGVGPRLEGEASAVDVSVQVRQTLEIAGEQQARAEVAAQAHRRHDAAVDLVRFELHHAIHATFHRALIARERTRVAERLLAFHEQLAEVARRRVAAGEDSPMDAQLASIELLAARQALSRARQSYLDARLTLAELSGLPSDPPPLPSGALDAPRRAPPVETIAAIARAQGPRIAALRAAAREARARADLANREGWPEPSIGFNYQMEGSPESAQREHVLLGVISIPIPIWHRNPIGRAEAEVDLHVARVRQDIEERLLVVRVRRYASAVDAAAERVERYASELLPIFEERLLQLTRAYELGEIGLLELSASRELVLDARIEAIDAHAEYFDAVTALEDAVGADVWPDPHHPGRTR